MLDSTKILAERATGVLYHYTSARSALNILETGEFQLSATVGVPAEEQYQPPGYPYFLSTTRSRVGDYHRITGNTGVMLVLDGDYFNQRGYKVRAIDYWERAWGHPETGRTSESEDRVYSRKPTIPAKNIRAVHVLIKSQDDLRSAQIRQLLIAAKKQGLPTYLYKDERAWRTHNIKRAIPIDSGESQELLRGRERSGWGAAGRNHLGYWLELLHKKSEAELSDRAKDLVKNLLVYNRGRGEDDMNLGVDLGNARKPTDQNHDTAVKIIELLKKYDLDTKKFVQMLHHRWEKIKYPTQEGLEDPKDNPCWKGYHPVGTKKKDGKTVPNCVPNESADLGADDLLLEVKMSPGALRKWAESPEAQGIVSGFEAELIFRDTSRNDEEESEPDWDMNEYAQDIDSVVDFFQGGDNGIGRAAAQRLRDTLWEDYIDWRDGRISDMWDAVEDEQVREYMETNVWEEDQDQYRERAATDLGIETSEESADQSEAIEKRARELFDEDVQTSIDEHDDRWQEAFEYFSDMSVEGDEDLSEREFFSDRYPYMQDVSHNFDVDWPYWTQGGYSAGRGSEDIADSLKDALGGADVYAGGGYHGAARRPGRWIIEPDGSLEPDDIEDAGLEIVSPPLPLAETLEKLDAVLDWANGVGDAYTNESTGLHMGVSVPYKGGAVDYVKLILFLGDEYILDKFGRAGNTYTLSAMDKLRRNIQAVEKGTISSDRRVNPVAAMELMQKGLIELANRYVQDSVGESKYTSAHIKDGYIEFRSPGGDYLSQADREIGVLRDTMLRFARAMHIASRPDLERDEYAKKLYKLIAPKGDDGLKLFAQFSTGLMSPEELKKQWASQVLSKESPKKSQEWEIVRVRAGMTDDSGEQIVQSVGTIKAADKDEAERLVRDRFDDWYRLEVRPVTQTDQEPPAEKKPSRRAQVAKKIAERPTLWNVSAGDRQIFVMARDTEEARMRAYRDDYFHRNRSYLEVRPATTDEIRQHRAQAADNAKDSEQVKKGTTGETRVVIYNPRTNARIEEFTGTEAEIQQRVQQLERERDLGAGMLAYRPADRAQQRADVEFPYRVTWRETRGGREIEDSINIDAVSAEAAVDNITRTLGYSGRVVRPGSVTAVPREEAGYEPGASRQDQPGRGPRREYQIYDRSTGGSLTGATLVSFMAADDQEATARVRLYREQHPGADVGLRTGGTSTPAQAQPQEEFTGRWLVRNTSTGEVVHTIAGIGNVQADANRHAARWLSQSGYDDPVDVVPEMR